MPPNIKCYNIYCSRKARCIGLCLKHYAHIRGSKLKPISCYSRTSCWSKDCSNENNTHHLCEKHYRIVKDILYNPTFRRKLMVRRSTLFNKEMKQWPLDELLDYVGYYEDNK